MVDIESRLVAWLGENMEFPWFGEVPAARPDAFGVVERTGGGMSDVVIDSPMVAIQVYAPCRSQAKNMAYAVRDVLPDFAYEDGICWAGIETLYNFPDETGNMARYQLIAHFKTY